MRSPLSFLSCGLVVLGLSACSSAQSTAQTGTTFCFNCHSETSPLGLKILWAQSGWETSVHSQGQVERDYSLLPALDPAASDPTKSATACQGFTTPVPPATYVTQNACETNGGTWVGPKYVLTGTEHTGSNAFYANAGGCQMCHTHEGFRKRISGQYDTADYSIKYSWDTRAQVGGVTTTPNTPLTADVITNPSPIGCFTCHTPHSIGTTDNVSLDQSIPEGTVITTQSGGVWGDNKANGHLCAGCHQIRQNNNASTSAGILAALKGTGKYNVSSPYGPHHGPQTDMNLGKGGAEYNGAAGGTFTFAGTYGNSPHTSLLNATCVTCHMQSDYDPDAFEPTGTFGVNPALGGHAMTNKGIVHGSEKAFVNGCGFSGCHTVSGVAGSAGNKVAAANIAKTIGYLQAGDAYFQKFAGNSDSNYHLKVNELLTKLANPSGNCGGLLDDAAVAAGGKHSWTLMIDGFTIDPRCISNGTTTGINKAASPADDNTNASVRFLKAIWNFKFVLVEDKSFGVHNTMYALELLYDSCSDLAVLTGKTCGSTPGRCSFCEGQYVTTRP